MPLYDFRCPSCDIEFERSAPMSQRNDQICHVCHTPLERMYKPTPQYKPWQPYFDMGLGVQITGQDHHRRVMRDLQATQRDMPSKGDRSARLDRCNDIRKRRRLTSR